MAAPVAAAPVDSTALAPDPITTAPVTGGGDVIETTLPPEPMPLPTTTGGGETGYDAPQVAETSNGRYVPAPTISQPAITPTTAAASTLATWPQWQTEFAKLGLNESDIATLAAQPLDDEQLAVAYQQVFTAVQGGATPSAPASDLPAPTTGSADATGNVDAATGSADTQPGWSPQWQAKFAGIGMPESIIQVYAQSGANAAGLEAGYQHAAGRINAFVEQGLWAKAERAGLDPESIWAGFVLSDQPQTDESMERQLGGITRVMTNPTGWLAQTGVSLLPGVRLGEFIAGKEAVSGAPIKQNDGTQIAFAVGSALTGVAALVAGARGGRNILAGLKASKSAFPALSQAVRAGGGTSVTAAAARTMSLNKLAANGHVEAFARKLSTMPEGSLDKVQRAVLAQMTDDIAAGRIVPRNSGMQLLGSMKSGQQATLTAARDGIETLAFHKHVAQGDGSSQLAAMLQAGGAKFARDPQWLAGRLPAHVIDAVAEESAGATSALGSILAGKAVTSMGGSVGGSGLRSATYLNGLGKAGVPEWYTKVLAATGDDVARATTAAPAAAASTSAPAATSMSTLSPELRDLFNRPSIDRYTNLPPVIRSSSLADAIAGAGH